MDSSLAHLFYRQERVKEFLDNKNLSQICSTDKGESKGIIVNKCYTEEDKS